MSDELEKRLAAIEERLSVIEAFLMPPGKSVPDRRPRREKPLGRFATVSEQLLAIDMYLLHHKPEEGLNIHQVLGQVMTRDGQPILSWEENPEWVREIWELRAKK